MGLAWIAMVGPASSYASIAMVAYYFAEKNQQGVTVSDILLSLPQGIRCFAIKGIKIFCFNDINAFFQRC